MNYQHSSEQDLFSKIIDMKNGSEIYIDISNKSDELKKLRLLDLQRQSYENLFTTCIVNNDLASNQFNLEKFLEKYRDVYVGYGDINRGLIINSVGSKVYKLMIKENIRFSINWDLEAIVISKHGHHCNS